MSMDRFKEAVSLQAEDAIPILKIIVFVIGGIAIPGSVLILLEQRYPEQVLFVMTAVCITVLVSAALWLAYALAVTVL